MSKKKSPKISDITKRDVFHLKLTHENLKDKHISARFHQRLGPVNVLSTQGSPKL